MLQLWRRACRRGRIVLAVVCLCVSAQPASAREDTTRGRPLGEVLRSLPGLRIVFSSEIVTPDMRVLSEPRAARPREILDEILKPHGLVAEQGPGGVIQIVRAERVRNPQKRSRQRGSATDASPLPRPAFAENVVVSGPAEGPRDRGVAGHVGIGPSDLQQLGQVPADGPQRVIHALPGVTAENDFRSELSVRGSPYRHIGVFVDGIPAPWLQHAIDGRDDVGSVAMISTGALDGATLQSGAYPQRYGTRLGAQLAFTLREGSRAATRVSGTLGGTSAAIVSEGPLAPNGQGSWLLAARQSYRDWPISRRTFDGTVLGFTDFQAKVAYDVAPGQQISVTALGGRMGADGPDEAAPEAFARATSNVAVISAAWRSAPSERLVVTQQMYGTTRQYRNSNGDGEPIARGVTSELSYRADAIRATSAGLLEFGGQLQQSRASRTFPTVEHFDGRAWFQSGYVNYSWQTGRMTITPGLRVTHSSLRDNPAVSRWILAEWRLNDGWALQGSTGVGWQFPDLEQIHGARGSSELAPERARYVDLGVEHQRGGLFRWRATVFARDERDLIARHERYENAGIGASRGIELLVERRSQKGLSGWTAYSFGSTRVTDRYLQQTTRAAFDQRHAIAVAAAYGFSDRTQTSAIFRGGSNFPGLPTYARLDVRAQHVIEVAGRRLTGFGEILNVLNHRNVGRTGGLAAPLLPRVAFAGLRIDF